MTKPIVNSAAQKESLFYIASALIAYGTTQITVDFYKGLIALVVAVGVVYLRHLVKKGESTKHA